MTMELTFRKGVLSSECLKVNSIVAFCGILRGELMLENYLPADVWQYPMTEILKSQLCSHFLRYIEERADV